MKNAVGAVGERVVGAPVGATVGEGVVVVVGLVVEGLTEEGEAVVG